jgi:hypothetical protein
MQIASVARRVRCVEIVVLMDQLGDRAVGILEFRTQCPASAGRCAIVPAAALNRRNLMPAVGADAAAGKATAARILTTAASTTSGLGRLPSRGKKRPANSLNENATTGVDARNRCCGFPASQCERPGVRAHGQASGNDFSNPLRPDASAAMSTAVVFDGHRPARTPT